MPKYLDKNGLLYFWQKIKAKFVADVEYDTTNKKLTKTVNSAKSDIVTIATIKTDLSLSKSDVGLGNVDNTSDANKPISTAMQTALNGKAASSHTHGNITNAGALQTTDVTIASGDKLVITDASNSNKVARASIAFDAATTTKALTQKGTWETFNNYTHPTYTAHDASAVKVGNDATGHVVLGDALTKDDVGLGNVDNTADANKSVSSAATLTTARNLEGVSFNGGADTSYYATCSTAAGTAAKTATIANQTFTLTTGARVFVKFTYANSATASTLNVNETGPKAIYYNGAAIGKSVTDAKGTYEFVYNGAQWELVGDLDTNTTYTAASTAPLMDGTATPGTATTYARGDHVHPSDTTKVDKEDGKGLSANDFTDTLKNKLDGIAEGANAYVHPSYTARTGKPTANAAPAFGGTFIISQVSSDASGHVSGMTDRTITIPSATATTTAAGLMSSTDKTKLDKLIFDSNNLIDSSILPSYVDDVIEAYARSGQTALSSTWLATGSASGTVITPEVGKIYVLMADYGEDYAANTQFRWSGTTYVKLNDGGVSAITNAEIDDILAA